QGDAKEGGTALWKPGLLDAVLVENTHAVVDALQHTDRGVANRERHIGRTEDLATIDGGACGVAYAVKHGLWRANGLGRRNVRRRSCLRYEAQSFGVGFLCRKHCEVHGMEKRLSNPVRGAFCRRNLR